MKELRVGLVLYGGVSLAVYMNGIATELWHLLRASRARQDGSAAALDGTARIYAGLLDCLEHRTGEDLRIVVDTIAGTSAGGLNGAVLAKAIADGGDADVLHRVWLEQADMARLRVEPSATLPWYGRALLSVAECVLRPVGQLKSRVAAIPNVSWRWLRDHAYSLFSQDDGRSTPLDGDYFTRMIARTFSDMGRGDRLLPGSASLDLYLTRTDLHGWPRHLPVGRTFHAQPLDERTHAHVMHFRCKPGGGKLQDDFGLTFATRSTAGFPLAFAPVNYESVETAYVTERPAEPVPGKGRFTNTHLREHALAGFPADTAWMIDGGVLDNKPFTHVARAIERKPARYQVCRVVAYVEPDPEATLEPPAQRAIPRPLQTVRDLYKLFRHEPVYEDLRRLADRNAKVRGIREFLGANGRTVHRAARLAGDAAGLTSPAAPRQADEWRQAANAYAARAAMSGYPGYVVLKARSATSVLADVICSALGLPDESRHARRVRQMVDAWGEERGAFSPPAHSEEQGYVLRDPQRALLKAFDVPFRLRRLLALVRAANELYQVPGSGMRAPAIDRSTLDSFKASLEGVTLAFERFLENDAKIRRTIREAFGAGDADSADDRSIARSASDRSRTTGQRGDRIDDLYRTLSGDFSAFSDRQDNRVMEAIGGLEMSHGHGYRPIMDAFVSFPFVDIMAFPLTEAAGIHDLVEIDVMRISPCDVPRRNEPPLKGRGLGGFQGFLERSAREHDIRWGRHDGADRVVAMVLEASQARQRCPQEAERIRRDYVGLLDAAIRDG